MKNYLLCSKTVFELIVSIDLKESGTIIVHSTKFSLKICLIWKQNNSKGIPFRKSFNVIPKYFSI